MFSKVKCVGVSAVVIFLSIVVCAASGPIGGTYSIKQVSEEGKSVSVRMSFRLFNHSNSDLKNAELILADHQPAVLKTPPVNGVAPSRFNNHGAVKIAAIKNHQELVIKDATFSIPALEYQQWQRGAQPVFVVSYAANNSRVEAPIQLVRMDGGAR